MEKLLLLELIFQMNKDIPEAYERLIYDAVNGDSTFFAHWKEVELSWEWVQPILNAFEGNFVPLHEYPFRFIWSPCF